MQKSLKDWLSYQETLHPTLIDPGLVRINAVAQRLGLLPFFCPVITVAGTNGKGSCVALSESVLLAQGYRVGCYISPHLLVYNERVRINGEMVSDVALCEIFELIEQARGGVSLSYFEFGTLAALLLFKQANVDIVVLEVGMGGRLDATNIIDADVAIISTVALDHMEWLGDTREKIGFEKAGIMRKGKPCVCGDFAVPASVRDHAKQSGAELYCQNEDFGYKRNSDNWSWWSKQQRLDDLPIPKIDLQNAATVLMALELLSNNSHSPSTIKQALQTVALPGRFQIFNYKDITIILDVAHNPAAAELLAKNLSATPCKGKTLAVVAMLADKDVPGTVEHLLPQIAVWHVAGLPVPRGGPAQTIADNLRALNAREVCEHDKVWNAFNGALAQAQAGDRIVVFGSFYTVAEVLHNHASFS